MKQLKPKKCRVCKDSFKPMSSLQIVCSPGCAMRYARAQQEKKEKEKAIRERRRLKEKRESIKSTSELLKEAQQSFNAFIRERDRDLPCISCGRFHTGQYHAGHYLSVGSRPNLRFNEENVHKQCAPCNNHLSGNLVNYRIGLIEKIGLDAVEKLESDHEPKRYRSDDAREIKRIYREKLKKIRLSSNT